MLVCPGLFFKYMSRQDIIMNAALGEVNTTENLTGKVFYDFRLLDREDEGRIYGEITLPADFRVRQPANVCIGVRIPYTPLYKELHVRLRLGNGNGHPEYLMNPTTNKSWYGVFREDESGVTRAIRLSQYGTIHTEGLFNLILRDGYLALFSGAETDLTIGASKYQNEVFLLKAFPGSLYQYPTTGVGLIDFLHGNFENNGLAAKLQSEFSSDNMIIDNAYMDSATGELLLETREKEDDNG